MKRNHIEEMAAESGQKPPPWIEAICTQIDQVLLDNIGSLREKVVRLEIKVDKATNLYESLLQESRESIAKKEIDEGHA